MISEEYFRILHEAAPYVKQHNKALFILYLPAEVCKSEQLESIVRELRIVSRFGSRVLIVFGLSRNGNAKINSTSLKRLQREAALIRLSFEQYFDDGYFFINGNNLMKVAPMGVVNGKERSHQGTIGQVAVKDLAKHIRKKICVISPIDYSQNNPVVLDPFETVIKMIAFLSADKLIIYSDKDTVFSHKKSFQMTSNEVGEWLKEKGIFSNRFSSLFTNAFNTRVSRIHLVNSTSKVALIRELYSTQGSGVLIRRAMHNKIRQAVDKDIGAIFWLLANPKTSSNFLERSRKYLERNVDAFLIAELDNEVIGTCEIKHRKGYSVAEIGGVCVHTDYLNRGIMRMLINRAEQNLAKKGIKKIFALTTRSELFFSHLGFQKTKSSELPNYRRASYIKSRRNALVFMKELV